jgi:hypothetical protein
VENYQNLVYPIVADQKLDDLLLIYQHLEQMDYDWFGIFLLAQLPKYKYIKIIIAIY